MAAAIEEGIDKRRMRVYGDAGWEGGCEGGWEVGCAGLLGVFSVGSQGGGWICILVGVEMLSYVGLPFEESLGTIREAIRSPGM